MLAFVASLFGCAHRRCTFPITQRERALEGDAAKTYIVCLDCGKEFPYDWQKMKIVPKSVQAAASKRPRVA